MSRRFFFFISLLGFFLGGCVTNSAPQTGRSTLWQIKTPSNTVYLMGSVHVLPKSAYPLKPALNRAFQDSRHVVFELDLKQGKTDLVMAKAFKAGLYPKGQKLSEHLSRETLLILKTLLPYYGIPLEKLEPLRPWLVSDLLTSLYLARAGYSSELGIDMHFLAKAEKSGKTIDGLEEVEAQTSPFRSLSDSQSDEYLRSSLASLPMLSAFFPKMISAWQNGDVRALNAIVSESPAPENALQKSIFTDRNNAWMPAIRHLLGRSENVLVVVGSGHLVGKTGIVAQSQREGYLVEQL